MTAITHTDRLTLLATLKQIDTTHAEIQTLSGISDMDRAEREIIHYEIQHRRHKIDQLHRKIVSIMTALILLILVSGCASTYPNMKHNHNKTRTDYYGNPYKWNGLFKQYQKRVYGMEAGPF